MPFGVLAAMVTLGGSLCRRYRTAAKSISGIAARVRVYYTRARVDAIPLSFYKLLRSIKQFSTCFFFLIKYIVRNK